MDSRAIDSRLEVRRWANPFDAQRIWDTIKEIPNQNRKPDIKEIVRLCNSNYKMKSHDVELQIANMTKDKLVIQSTSYISKGPNKGKEQIIYEFPNECDISPKTDHDWYCFNCHKPGKVIACGSCYRVYHEQCITTEINANNFICTICQELQSINVTELTAEIEGEELNELLGYICGRLKTLLPIDIQVWIPKIAVPAWSPYTTDRCAVLNQKKQITRDNSSGSQAGNSLRNKLLIHHPIQISDMFSKCDRQVYKSLAQFRIDSLSLVHNVAVFHGADSTIADSTRFMHRDCLNDLEEILVCRECFRSSYKQKDDIKWFCKPCSPPHKLVYAKVQGHPFWPAKVLKIDGENHHVRFFGNKHERSIVESSQIRSICIDPKTLVSKRTHSWQKAMQELEEHQKWLASGFSNEVEGSISSEDEEPLEKMMRTEVRLQVEKLDVILNKQDLSIIFGQQIASNTELLDYKRQCTSLAETVAKLSQEVIQLKESHSNQIQNLESCHVKEISEVKKKDWCIVCQNPGIYECCQRTHYCSSKCQVVHWRLEHKAVCSRKKD